VRHAGRHKRFDKMSNSMVKIEKPESCRGCPVSGHKNTLYGGVIMTSISLPKPSSKINQKRLKKLLNYDPETGLFHWLASGKGVKPTLIAGYVSRDGYVHIRIDKISYKSSRLAFLWMEGYFPEHNVDHVNRIRNDDRWVNLRHVTQRCNIINSSMQKNNTSGITGVNWENRDKRWHSRIKINRKTKHLGYYIDLKDAVEARWKAEVRYAFPNCNSTSSAFKFLEDLNV